MSVDGKARRPMAIGVALGADRLVAALPAGRGGAGECWVRPLGPGPGDRGAAGAVEGAGATRAPAAPPRPAPWPDLAVAFGELAERVGARAVALHVALLPPLAEVRHLVLPRLGDDALRHVLRRDAARYFLAGAGRVVVGGEPLSRRRRTAGPVCAAAAPEGVVDAVVAAAEAVGWRVATIVPAESAWAAAARAAWRELARGAGTVIVPGDGRTDVLCLRRGRLVALRRTRSIDEGVDDLAELVAEASAAVGRERATMGWPDAGGGGTGGGLGGDDAGSDDPAYGAAGAQGASDDSAASPVAVLADGATRERIEAVLAGLGLRVLPAAVASAEVAALLAALHAPRAAGPELLPDVLHVARRRRARRGAAILAASAVALLAGAAGLEYHGLGRELEVVAGRRAEIRAGVEEALRAREVLTALDDRLAALRAIEATGPRWSDVVPILAEHLPRGAHLVALRAVGDSVVLEGAASNAAAVFEALRAAPGIDGVRADAPIRREVGEGGAPVEWFAVALRLAPASGAAATDGVADGVVAVGENRNGAAGGAPAGRSAGDAVAEPGTGGTRMPSVGGTP